MELKDKKKPRAQFVTLVNYFQNNIDFDKLEADGMINIYYEGMSFFEEICGNAGSSFLYEGDIEILLSLRHKNLTTKEIAQAHSLSEPSVHPKMRKLISKGMVSSFKEKKETYYKLTPYGNKYLLEKILEN